MPDTQEQEKTGETPASWESWLASQADDIKALYEGHSKGLLNSVRATREERDGFKKQVDELRARAEKGSDIEKSLEKMSGELEITRRRAAFYEDAGNPEIGCRNPKAAFTLAVSENLFKRDGSVDWMALKDLAPELFGKDIPAGAAGSGTSQRPAGISMNDWIRSQAGRK